MSSELITPERDTICAMSSLENCHSEFFKFELVVLRAVFLLRKSLDDFQSVFVRDQMTDDLYALHTVLSTGTSIV